MEISFDFFLLTLSVNYIQDLGVNSAMSTAQTGIKKNEQEEISVSKNSSEHSSLPFFVQSRAICSWKL